MRVPFKIEGVDLETGTVVVEIRRELLAPLSKALRNAQPSGHNQIHHALYRLAHDIRNSARVLYGEYDAERFGFDLLDPEEDEEEMEVRTGTDG